MRTDPHVSARDSGDDVPVGALVGCPSRYGMRDWPGRRGTGECTEECRACHGAGVVEKIGFSSYQRLDGYR